MGKVSSGVPFMLVENMLLLCLIFITKNLRDDERLRNFALSVSPKSAFTEHPHYYFWYGFQQS